MNAQTFFILLAVLVGSFHLVRVAILAIAAAFEIWRVKTGRAPFHPTFFVDDVLNLLTVREWMAPPRRRLVPVR